MSEKYHGFHAGCLRSESVAPGLGKLIVVLAKAIHIACREVGPLEPTHMLLQEGTIPYASVGLIDVKCEIDKHLEGFVGVSELRLGISGLLGLEPATGVTIALSSDDEHLIDEWLDEYAIFIIASDQDYTTAAALGPSGVFNGIKRAWNGETYNQGGEK